MLFQLVVIVGLSGALVALLRPFAGSEDPWQEREPSVQTTPAVAPEAREPMSPEDVLSWEALLTDAAQRTRRRRHLPPPVTVDALLVGERGWMRHDAVTVDPDGSLWLRADAPVARQHRRDLVEVRQTRSGLRLGVGEGAWAEGIRGPAEGTPAANGYVRVVGLF